MHRVCQGGARPDGAAPAGPQKREGACREGGAAFAEALRALAALPAGHPVFAVLGEALRSGGSLAPSGRRRGGP